MEQPVLLKWTKGWGRKSAWRLNVKERIKENAILFFFSVNKRNPEMFANLKENHHTTVPAKGSIKSFKVNNCLSLTSPHSFEIKWPHFFSIFRFVFGHVADSLHLLSTRNSSVFPLPPNFAGTRRQTRHLGYVSTSPSLVINRRLWGKIAILICPAAASKLFLCSFCAQL